MQLISPKKLEDTAAAETALRLIRIEELRKAEERARIQLNQTEDDFKNMLERHKQEWEKEFQAYKEKKDFLEKEIQKLTAEKMSIAVPFEIIKQGADARVQEANELLQCVQQKELDADELTERLEEKLDAVEQKGEDLRIREQKVAIREMNVKDIEEHAQTGTKDLGLRIVEFNAYKKKELSDMDKRKTEIILKERTLETKAISILAREKEIENEKKRIADERIVLAQAFEEVRRREKALVPPLP